MRFDYHIKVPQWGAGSTYGWDKKKYGIRGIGLAKFRIRSSMIFKVGINYYRVTREDIDNFMKQYPDSVDNKKGTMLCVFPISIMQLVKEGIRKNLKPKETAIETARRIRKGNSEQLTLL